MKISIIGAGIAGLCTAIALKDTDLEIEIFEGATEIKSVGAGLVLAANAIRGLYKLGIADEVIKAGHLVPSFTICDEKKKTISFTDSNKISTRYGTDNFTIHRAALHKVLLSNLGRAKITTGKIATGFVKNTSGISVQFKDGNTHQADALVVADGIHSTIRQQLVAGSLPRYAGYTCWRAITDNNLQITDTSETWGTAGRFGIVPLSGNQVYWFACINAPRNSTKYKQFGTKELAEHFSRFHHPVADLIHLTDNKNLIHNDIIDLEPLDKFAFENIILIGDAAHATTPNMGQGACQAIEDAVVLGEEIKKNRNAMMAFKAFEKRRLHRTRFITEQSYRIGKISQIENRFLAWLRNTLLRNMPASMQHKRLEQLYKTDF